MGISYSNELHHRIAAIKSNYTWEEFCALDGDAQSAIVGAYECMMQIEAIIAQEQTSK